MNNGYIEQVDKPIGIFSRPSTAFVASFIGGHNIIEGTLTDSGLTTGDERLIRLESTPLGDTDNKAAVSLRCDRIQISPQPFESAQPDPMRVESVEYQGSYVHLRGQFSDGLGLSVFQSDADYLAAPLNAGDQAFVGWRHTDLNPLRPGSDIAPGL